MAADPQQDVMTVSEYLHGEDVGDVKHEYVSGHVYAMETIGFTCLLADLYEGTGL